MKPLRLAVLFAVPAMAVCCQRVASANPRPLPYTYPYETSAEGQAELEQYFDLTVVKKYNDDKTKRQFDGKKAIEATAAPLVEPGLVGVWTKADSVTHFDELKVTSLDTNK